jgi:hypothetical protein
MKDKKMFGEFILAIGEMFDKDISDVLRQLYWKALEPFTDKQCEKAFNTVILSSRFMPKPVDIIEAIRGNNTDRATSAWIDVLKTVRRVGTWESVKFADPVIHSVIESMGGWIRLGQTPETEIKWKQKEFERLYQVIQEREGTHPDHLPGVFEMENSAQGYVEHIPEPVLIGTQKEVKKIEVKP